MICISTTSNSEEVLKKISSEVLEKKLSPCTHITEISQSSYIWKNEIVQKVEFELKIKTIESHKNKIISVIKQKHNYKIFELSSFQVNSLNEEYNNWFNSQLK